MSRFLSESKKRLVPYTPGEQPKTRKFLKLNTNESPFPPSPKAQQCAAEALNTLELYSDPTCAALVKKACALFGVEEEEILFTNGSDEILNFAFMAFCDAAHPAVFPDITYGFYPVFADVNGVPYREIPLDDHFRICVEDYTPAKGTVFIANPNAPTGTALTLSQIETILKANPDNVVVMDEAYVDFGAESAVGLIHRYDNLLVTRTFSKSRSMAGARLGFGIACKELIRDLNTIKYSTNPYNVNAVTMAAGIGALQDEAYTQKNIQTIIENRTYTVEGLQKIGFAVLPSQTNFIFAKHPGIGGEKLYAALKEKGILVRHFNKERIKAFNRITIGTKEQMQILIHTITEILTAEGIQ